MNACPRGSFASSGRCGRAGLCEHPQPAWRRILWDSAARAFECCWSERAKNGTIVQSSASFEAAVRKTGHLERQVGGPLPDLEAVGRALVDDFVVMHQHSGKQAVVLEAVYSDLLQAPDSAE